MRYTLFKLCLQPGHKTYDALLRYIQEHAQTHTSLSAPDFFDTAAGDQAFYLLRNGVIVVRSHNVFTICGRQDKMTGLLGLAHEIAAKPLEIDLSETMGFNTASETQGRLVPSL